MDNIVEVSYPPISTNTLIIKHGTSVSWNTINPILFQGELGIENDTNKMKVGDGITEYNDLPYINITPAQISNLDEINEIIDNLIDILDAKQDVLEFEGEYNASTNKVATESTISNAISELISTLIGEPAANKTIVSFEEVEGKVTVTFEDINITLSQISDAGVAASKEVVTNIITDVEDENYNGNSSNVPAVEAVVNHVTNVINELNSSAIASAAEDNEYSVLTGISEVDGIITKTSEVKLAAIAKTGNIKDLIQESGDALILNCGSSTEVI